jgi:hypothetical protein
MSEENEQKPPPVVVVRRDAEVTVTPGVITVAPWGEASGQTPDEGASPVPAPEEEEKEVENNNG